MHGNLAVVIIKVFSGDEEILDGLPDLAVFEDILVQQNCEAVEDVHHPFTQDLLNLVSQNVIDVSVEPNNSEPENFYVANFAEHVGVSNGIYVKIIVITKGHGNHRLVQQPSNVDNSYLCVMVMALPNCNGKQDLISKDVLFILAEVKVLEVVDRDFVVMEQIFVIRDAIEQEDATVFRYFN